MKMYEEPKLLIVRINYESDVLTLSGEPGMDFDSTWLNDDDFS